MNPLFDWHADQTRRQFFAGPGLRFGGLALGMMLGGALGKCARGDDKAIQRVAPALTGFPHHKPKAKALIYLHMNGAPSQLDLWDYKPGLQEFFDKELPASVQGGQRLTTMTSGQGRFPVAPSKFKFEQMGKCGRWINNELLPHTAKVV